MSHPLDLDLRTLELFAAANELGSISKAAARHHLSQPVASRKLRNLERRLGFEVFHRTATGVTLSPRGTRFLQLSQELLADARRFGDAVESLAAGEQGVTLAATTNVARHDLPEIAAEIATDDDPAAAPRIRITLMNTLDICRALRNDEADVGLIDGPRAPVGLTSKVLCSHELIPVVSPDHPWADRASISADELAAVPLLLPPPGTGSRDVIDDALHDSGVRTIASPLMSAHADQRIAMAIVGSGVAIVRAEAAVEQLDTDRLIALDVDGLFRQPIRVAWKGAKPNRRIGAVIERIRAWAE